MGSEGTPFDDVFKTLLEKCTDLIIPVLNEVFGTGYKMNEPVSVEATEHHFTDEKVERRKRITDSCIKIRNHRYHVECESVPNTHIAIRMVEYDFHIALSDMEAFAAGAKVKDGGDVLEDAADRADYILRFPKSAVLYLRHNSSTKETLCVRMLLPDGTKADYRIPTVKVQEYTKKEILDKRLLFLVPFYILRYEKELSQINESEERLHELAQDYKSIYEYLRELESGMELSESYLYNLIQLTQQLVEVVAKRAGNVRREVNTMGGKVLELESERLIKIGMERGIEQGMEYGIEQGIERGIKQGLSQKYEQVTKSILGVMNKFNLSFEKACEVCDVPLEEYEFYRERIYKFEK